MANYTALDSAVIFMIHEWTFVLCLELGEDEENLGQGTIKYIINKHSKIQGGNYLRNLCESFIPMS